MEGWKDGRIERWMDRKMDGQKDGWIERQKDENMNELALVEIIIFFDENCISKINFYICKTEQ